MKRYAVIKKLRAEARRRGLEFEEIRLTRHDAYRVGNTTRTLGRHSEIDDLAAQRVRKRVVAMNVYKVTAERGRSGAWVLECDELGVVSQTRRLDRAEGEVAEAIAFQSGLQPGEFKIEVVPILPAEVETLRQRADDLGVKAKAASEEAAAARAALARKLKDEGFTLREMGQVLGVSYQRASELAAGEGTGGRR